ncbi:MAG: CsbD family protein [Pseudobdellovibrionaceae bacterium]
MAINQDIVNGKWLELKGEIQKAWGKLTSDELEQTKGDVKSIAGLVLQKYGEGQEKFQQKFAEILEPLQGKKEQTVSAVKESLKS